MPKKKTKKTKAAVERKKRAVADEYAAIQKPEPAASAVQLIDSIFQRRSKLISLGAEVDNEQSYLAHERVLLGETKISFEGFSVNFGWSEDSDTPLGCITIANKDGEYNFVEVALDDLRTLAEWLNEQLTRMRP